MSELPKRTPTTYEVNDKIYPGVTPELLGTNADFTKTVLNAYIDFDGIQVEPSRVNLSNTLRYNVDLEKK